MFERETAEKKQEKRKEEEETIVVQSDEAMAKMAMGLLRAQDPDQMSEVSTDQHKALTALATRAEKYSIGCLQTYLEYWLKMMISKDRKGRKEIHSIATAIRGEEGSQSKLDRLKGIFGMGDDY